MLDLKRADFVNKHGEPTKCLNCGRKRFKMVNAEIEDIGVKVVKDYTLECRHCGKVAGSRVDGVWKYAE